MNDVLVTAESLEAALERAGERFSVPVEALEYETVGIDAGELLHGAGDDEEVGVSIRVWIKVDYLSERSGELLLELLKHMEIPAEVDRDMYAGLIVLRIRSNENSRLIGRNGETLEAIEYIVNRMLARGGVISPPVIVDVEEYRQRRIGYLERQAKRAASKAARTQEDVELHPMKPSERKIVHAMLAPVSGIKTFSRGVEEERQVVIGVDGEEVDDEIRNYKSDQIDKVDDDRPPARRREHRPAPPRRSSRGRRPVAAAPPRPHFVMENGEPNGNVYVPEDAPDEIAEAVDEPNGNVRGPGDE